MNILAIETSCDETAIALVEIKGQASAPRVKVLKSIVSSQVKIHAPFGGVVPTLAKREHIKNLPLIWKKFLKHPVVKSKKVDLLTVTVGPGLEPALWTGITFAQELHEQYFEKKIPLVGANHLHGHLYSFLLSREAEPSQAKVRPPRLLFPMVSLIVSGGHTILGVLKNLNTFKKLGETKDDAVGECFDKVARLLKLPYPGGPEIEKISRTGSAYAIPFPSPMLSQKNYDFSYSGLKTAVLYYLRDLQSQGRTFPVPGRRTIRFSDNVTPVGSELSLPTQGSTLTKADIAASFQEAAFRVLVKKTARAADEYKAKSVSIGGGVAASKALRRMLRKGLVEGHRSQYGKESKDVRTTRPTDQTSIHTYSHDLLVPPFRYCMDNAVMIAVAGFMAYEQKKKYPLKANGILNL